MISATRAVAQSRKKTAYWRASALRQTETVREIFGICRKLAGNSPGIRRKLVGFFFIFGEILLIFCKISFKFEHNFAKFLSKYEEKLWKVLAEFLDSSTPKVRRSEHLVDLEKCRKIHLLSLSEASIQRRTSTLKFARSPCPDPPGSSKFGPAS